MHSMVRCNFPLDDNNNKITKAKREILFEHFNDLQTFLRHFFLSFHQGNFFATQPVIRAPYILSKNWQIFNIVCLHMCYVLWRCVLKFINIPALQQHCCWFWSDCVAFEVRCAYVCEWECLSKTRCYTQ